MSHVITVQDGTGDTTTPYAIRGISAASKSGNIIHELIAPGEIAVTLVGDLPRAGVLTLVYLDDPSADAAREVLGRAAAFVLTSDRASLSMTFVRAGEFSPTIHDDVRSLWTFEVGYQEIVP